MDPFETYMRVMRPFMLPGILMIESYADFLKEVGQGSHSQHTSSQADARDPVLEAKLDSAAPHPAPAAFDPFDTWRNLSAFIPAVNGPTAQAPQHERGHSAVASEKDAVTPAKALLNELEAEAEHIRQELADLDSRDQAQAQRQSPVHPEPNHESGGITHEAAQKRAKKAWRTRRANAAREEERKAARRKARSGSRHVTRRAGRA